MTSEKDVDWKRLKLVFCEEGIQTYFGCEVQQGFVRQMLMPNVLSHSGPPGEGRTGSQGPPGRPGIQGTSGRPGISGSTGPAGPPGYCDQNSCIGYNVGGNPLLLFLSLSQTPSICQGFSISFKLYSNRYFQWVSFTNNCVILQYA